MIIEFERHVISWASVLGDSGDRIADDGERHIVTGSVHVKKHMIFSRNITVWPRRGKVRARVLGVHAPNRIVRHPETHRPPLPGMFHREFIVISNGE